MTARGAALPPDAALPPSVRVLVGVTQPDDAGRPLSAWLKDPRSVVGDGETVVARSGHHALAVEAEVALVIGAPTAGVVEGDLRRCVHGWTVGDDVTDLAEAAADPRTFRAKNGRGYTPIGPALVPGLPAADDTVVVRIDDVELCRTTVGSLAVTPLDVLGFVTRWIDLEPGDVVLTGAITPSIPVHAGARVEMSIGTCGPLHTVIGA